MPFDNLKNYYWSLSRAYSPKIKEWLSVDPLIKWNPRKLIDNPGNWFSVRYSNNDPLNFVDPSGHAVQVISRHVAFGQRHLLMNITPADNYVESPRILSLIGPSGFSGLKNGGIASLPYNGNKHDKEAVYGDTAKQIQTIEKPSFYKSQKDFQDNLIDLATGYDVNSQENRYPSYGGLFDDNARNSNTYVDDTIESAGGDIMDFDNTPLQNSGE